MSFTIEQVTKDNCHLFDDMVYSRINGRERTKEEKEASKQKVYEKASYELLHPGFKVYAALYGERFIGWISCVAVSIRLYTQDDNIAAQKLYEKCGFKIKGKAVFMETEDRVRK